MSKEDIHEKSLRLIDEHFDSISDEQFLATCIECGVFEHKDIDNREVERWKAFLEACDAEEETE